MHAVVPLLVQVWFANGLRGGGTNFTVTNTLPNRLTLELQEGSTWIKVGISLNQLF